MISFVINFFIVQQFHLFWALKNVCIVQFISFLSKKKQKLFYSRMLTKIRGIVVIPSF